MKQLYFFNTLKLSLLMMSLAGTSFGVVKVYAGTVPTIWYYQQNMGTDYSVCQVAVSSNQNCTYDAMGNLVGCTTITPNPGYIWVDRSYTTGTGQNMTTIPSWQQCLASSQYTIWQTMATYAAATNKDVYTPGEPVTVNVVATVGDTGNQIGGFFSGGIINGFFCFFLGCTAPKGVTADATLAVTGQSVASCGGSGTCNNSPGQTFTAPATPATYTLNLTGGYWLAGMNAYSSMSFMVASPPSVTIKFVFLNRIKNSLQNIFAFTEQKKALDKVFTEMMQ